MSRRTVAIIQARMTSSRLPGKVLLPLAGTPVLTRVVERVRAIADVHAVCVAAPEGPDHDPLADLVDAMEGVQIARGSEHDVLRRTRAAAEMADAEVVMRVTSDCPLIDPGVSGAVLAMFEHTGVSYAATAMETGYPVGLDTEVLSMAALRAADDEATDPYEREHVTPFIWRRPERFCRTHLDRQPDLRHWRLVLDTARDYELVSAIYDALQDEHPMFGMAEVTALLARRPELLNINRTVQQNPYEWEDTRHDRSRDTKQLDAWRGEFGDDYIERNLPTEQRICDRVRAFADMLAPVEMEPPATILEAGCNVGLNLRALSRLTTAELHAVEPNARARATVLADGVLPADRLHDATLASLPFDDGSMDLVFTAGVLIHVPPDCLERAYREIYRVSRRYILVQEYFSRRPEAIHYRGSDDLLFKRDFGGMWLDLYPELRHLAHGFHWERTSGLDDPTWWLFEKR